MHITYENVETIKIVVYDLNRVRSRIDYHGTILVKILSETLRQQRWAAAKRITFRCSAAWIVSRPLHTLRSCVCNAPRTATVRIRLCFTRWFEWWVAHSAGYGLVSVHTRLAAVLRSSVVRWYLVSGCRLLECNDESHFFRCETCSQNSPKYVCQHCSVAYHGSHTLRIKDYMVPLECG